MQRDSRIVPAVVLGPDLTLATAPTAGARLFVRCPPVHSILLGRCRLQLGAGVHAPHTFAVAIPANTPHAVLSFADPCAGAAYLDPRRYDFRDVQRLAHAFRGFAPGRDDLHEAFADAHKLPRRRLDWRLQRVLDALDERGLSVAEAAGRVGLSESRVTHLMTETLGAPPRTWRAWLKLKRALGERLLRAATFTQAAHRAGFTDSPHFTRTCRKMTGLLPGQMLPESIRVSLASGGTGDRDRAQPASTGSAI